MKLQRSPYMILVLLAQFLIPPTAQAEKKDVFSLQLREGKLVFNTFGRWKWSDTCHSLQTPCYHGTLYAPGNSKPLGTGYLFAAQSAAPTSPAKLPELCQGVYELQKKYSQIGSNAKKLEALRIQKNKKGQSYCSWSQGPTSTYLWSAGKTMISISFGAVSDSSGHASPSFKTEVEKFASEVSYHGN